MSYTLAEMAKYSLPDQEAGIIETIIDVGGEVIDKLPWMTLKGESKDYVREATLPLANVYDVNEDLAESTGTGTPVSVSLKRIFVQSDLDKFERDTYNDINEPESMTLKNAVKSCTRKWNDLFIYGNSATNTKEFDGLHKLMSTSAVDPIMRFTMAADATGAALSLASLDKMLDAIEPDKATVLIINKTIRRRLAQALRTSTVAGYVVMPPDQFGRTIDYYGGIPVFISDYMPQTELCDGSGWFSTKTGLNTSSIFAVKFGTIPEGGLCGLMASKSRWEVERIDPLEDKNSVRYRVGWYCALALGRYQSLARLGNITDAAVTA